MPGSIVDEFIPLIERETGFSYPEDFGICYVPDFVALGSVLRDFQNPDFLLVGSNDKRSYEVARTLYSHVVSAQVPVRNLSIEEAEIAKVSLNAYICTKISFANFLGQVAEHFTNVDVDNITSTLGLDRRIGSRYFKAGAPFGGTCFPRDTWAFKRMANSVGLVAGQIESSNEINQSLFHHLLL